VAQRPEETGIRRELVQENDVEDNPANGEQAVSSAVSGSREREWHWHPENADGNGQRGAEADERRDMGAQVKEREAAQQHDNGQRGKHRGKKDVPERVVRLRPVHGRT